jgi:hypothetical protein
MVAIGKLNGRPTVFIGLTFSDLQRFKRWPLTSFITITYDKTITHDTPGLSHDIVILSGKTEQEIELFIREQSPTMQ